jgi:hypothetical protein
VDLHHHGDTETGPGLLDFAVNVYGGPRPAWLEAALLEGITAPSSSAAATPADITRAVRLARRVGAAAALVSALLAAARPTRGEFRLPGQSY